MTWSWQKGCTVCLILYNTIWYTLYNLLLTTICTITFNTKKSTFCSQTCMNLAANSSSSLPLVNWSNWSTLCFLWDTCWNFTHNVVNCGIPRSCHVMAVSCQPLQVKAKVSPWAIPNQFFLVSINQPLTHTHSSASYPYSKDKWWNLETTRRQWFISETEGYKYIFFCLRRFKTLPHSPQDSFYWIVTAEHQVWKFMNLSTVMFCFINTYWSYMWMSQADLSLIVHQALQWQQTKEQPVITVLNVVHLPDWQLLSRKILHRLDLNILSSTLKWMEFSSLSSLISIQICLRILMSLFSFLFLLT